MQDVPRCKLSWVGEGFYWNVSGALHHFPSLVLALDSRNVLIQKLVFPKKMYPQIINFNRVFHYKPSILEYPYFWKHPNRQTTWQLLNSNSGWSQSQSPISAVQRNLPNPPESHPVVTRPPKTIGPPTEGLAASGWIESHEMSQANNG